MWNCTWIWYFVMIYAIFRQISIDFWLKRIFNRILVKLQHFRSVWMCLQADYWSIFDAVWKHCRSSKFRISFNLLSDQFGASFDRTLSKFGDSFGLFLNRFSRYFWHFLRSSWLIFDQFQAVSGSYFWLHSLILPEFITILYNFVVVFHNFSLSSLQFS